MTTRSSGFSLIELLVVVVILGVIGTIGVLTYKGYISSTERKSAENLIRQIALGQTEYYSDNQEYFTNSGGSTCTPSVKFSKEIETDLLNGSEIIIDSNANPKKAHTGFLMCITPDSGKFKTTAQKQLQGKAGVDKQGCKIEITASNKITRTNC